MHTTETTYTAGLLTVEEGTFSISAPPRGSRTYRELVASVPKGTINREANAARLVACWNACDGESLEDLLAPADPWHLFRIDASDADGCHGFIVSAQSGSQAKAQELAESAALDDIGTDDEPGCIDVCTPLGTTDSDVFERFGPV